MVAAALIKVAATIRYLVITCHLPTKILQIFFQINTKIIAMLRES
jgi:hypothetical protein